MTLNRHGKIYRNTMCKNALALTNGLMCASWFRKWSLGIITVEHDCLTNAADDAHLADFKCDVICALRNSWMAFVVIHLCRCSSNVLTHISKDEHKRIHWNSVSLIQSTIILAISASIYLRGHRIHNGNNWNVFFFCLFSFVYSFVLHLLLLHALPILWWETRHSFTATSKSGTLTRHFPYGFLFGFLFYLLLEPSLHV